MVKNIFTLTLVLFSVIKVEFEIKNRRYPNRVGLYLEVYFGASLRSLINIGSDGAFADKETINWRQRARGRFWNPLESFPDTFPDRYFISPFDNRAR